MFKNKKYIITVTIVFTIGTLLGVIIGAKYGGAFIVLQQFNEMEKFQESKNELEEKGFAKCSAYYSEKSYEAYLQEKPVVGTWALNGEIDILNILLTDHKEYNDLFSEETLYADLMFTHARLSKLYEKLENQNLVNENIKKALSYSNLAYPEYKVENKQKLLEIIDRLDKNIAASKINQ